ncbi:hypothetical protein HW555_001697 [Spodoptera exigua]|uniref:Uncharacterized protein n=1 Tax=Spodoptera exigua TaxID=7107 RepID=A0A835GR22_SPOEX|nr:hypothetical protein HW555_001697 [Spodoptera exigua]
MENLLKINEADYKKDIGKDIGRQRHLPAPDATLSDLDTFVGYENRLLLGDCEVIDRGGRRAWITRRGPSAGGAPVCVTDHGGAGGARPAATVKRARRIRAAPRLKAIRPPGLADARLARATPEP